jgi:hypothetical protein
MTERIDGGPAFPPNPNDAEGMSLRDWFAGMAMQGLLANCGADSEQIAKKAYEYADAMLVERNR